MGRYNVPNFPGVSSVHGLIAHFSLFIPATPHLLSISPHTPLKSSLKSSPFVSYTVVVVLS